MTSYTCLYYIFLISISDSLSTKNCEAPKVNALFFSSSRVAPATVSNAVSTSKSSGIYNVLQLYL